MPIVVPAVPAPDHRSNARWAKSSWNEVTKQLALNQCIGDGFFNAAHGQKERTLATILASLNSLPSFKQEGVLTSGALTAFVTKELAAREVERKADLHATGAGDQEYNDYTRALDDCLQLRDDGDSLQASSRDKTQEQRDREARLKEEGDLVRARAIGMVTPRHKANVNNPGLPPISPSPAKRFKPQQVLQESQDLQKQRLEAQAIDRDAKRKAQEAELDFKKADLEHRRDEEKNRQEAQAANTAQQQQMMSMMMSIIGKMSDK